MKKASQEACTELDVLADSEIENDWYVSKHLRKPFHSTTTAVAWHPNSILLGVGSTDGHARVLSAFIKGVDERPEATAWGSRLPFNTVCGEFMNQTAGWVKGVAFSPSGDAMAFAGMDSTVTIAYPGGEDQPPKAVVSVSSQALPFADLLWLSESEIVCAGYVGLPLLLDGLPLIYCVGLCPSPLLRFRTRLEPHRLPRSIG